MINCSISYLYFQGINRRPRKQSTLVTIKLQGEVTAVTIKMFHNCFFLLMDRKGEFNWCSRNFPNGDYFTPFPHGEGWIL